jgi:hypothetical protein
MTFYATRRESAAQHGGKRPPRMDARLLYSASMPELFARTLSAGLQASIPVAVAIVWFRRTHRFDLARAVTAGCLAAMPLTIAIGWLFDRSSRQAWWEAAAAIGTTAIALAAMRAFRRDRPDRNGKFAVAAAAALIVVRQTMLIGATFDAAAFQVRSLDATIAVVSAAAVALALACAWIVASKSVAPRGIVDGTMAFAALFLPYAALCAFHKSAEARWLPWSDVLDAATEPYGPDSAFGRNLSFGLALIPMAAAAWHARRRIVRIRRVAAVGSGALVTACAVFLLATSDRAAMRHEPDPSPTMPAASASVAVAAIGAPRLMFISTAADANYRQVSVASMPRAGAPVAPSVPTPLRCERVSFAAGRGICLQAERGLFTTYTAVLVDERMQPRSSFKLEGSPSRTRMSSDGRVGAITIFLTGRLHGYASSSFSTKTVLVDMAGGNVIGDLEEFSTWRDGKRFSAADFNFWGVTFARDSHTFYATLQTAAGAPPTRGRSPQRARTYLVRGDLGLRRLTVLHENVECPSLSPDNRLIAFKKRVSWDQDPWRLYLLDLATMTEAPIEAEHRSIDDQIEWLDDAHILYSAPRSSDSATTDVYLAPVAGGQAARVFLPAAQSPIVVR